MYVIFNEEHRITGVVRDLANEDIFTSMGYYDIPAAEYLKTHSKGEKLISEIFEDAQFYHEFYSDGNDIIVEIEWGDWKHDHMFCDDLMMLAGYKRINETVTEENDSDCYSAIRRYAKA